MSAVGGVIDFRDGAIDFSLFDSIRKSMALRGRDKSTAYIDVGVGMFFNADEYANEEQPIIRDHRGYKSVFLMDSPYLDGKAVFEKYSCLGVDFLGVIEAPFAIALYDHERRLFLLARDREGRKPLFYSVKDGRICFASESKGILETLQDNIRVNRDVLSLHFTSHSGIYGSANIYSDVYEVRAGECILFTEIGMSRFFFRDSMQKKKVMGKNIFKEKYKPYDIYYNIEAQDVKKALSDSLVAFDMPQFHADMPMLCKLFSSMEEKGVTVFKYRDYIKKDARSYAYDIEDRLGNFYNVLGCGVISKIDEDYFDFIRREREKIYNDLLELFYLKQGDKEEFFCLVLGKKKMERLLRIFDDKNSKKEDTEIKTRILGMLCQSLEWIKIRNLNIIGQEDKDDCMFFDD